MAMTTQALVEPDWLEAHLGDPNVRVIALNWTDSQMFDAAHIPGAIYWDWKSNLWDPLIRDFPSPKIFAQRCAAAGISNDTTVVFYGDPSIVFGTYAWWIFKYCGHADTRVLNGSRKRWESEGRSLTANPTIIEPAIYAPNERPNNANMRIGRDEVLARLGKTETIILDHRSPEEYYGERYSPPTSPNHGAERLGRIPGARHLHSEDLIAPDGSFLPTDQIRELLAKSGASPEKEIISYCRLSHRASFAYFAITQLLGYPNARMYDGSWTEWGSLVGVPIER